MWTPGATQLRETEARLDVQFPRAFRDAVLEQRTIKSGSRYILLPLDEVDTTDEWGVPGSGIVVARTVAGGYVVLPFASNDESSPRAMTDAPLLWEPDDDDDDGQSAELRSIGDSFDDVLDPTRFDKSRLCPHCGSELVGSPCSVCGRRRGEASAKDADRDVASAMVSTLVESGELVTRSARSTARVVNATVEILRRVDDDTIAAEQIVEAWEDAPEVEEVFVGPEELLARFLTSRRR